MVFSIERIISGGQTGVDRAALDWAIATGIPHGGWCPKGRLAEDGPIPVRYELQETASSDYAIRTQWNIRDSDATVIFSCSKQISGGTALTYKLGVGLGKPLLHVHAGQGIAVATSNLKSWIQKHGIKVLNVAGPRESKEPEVGDFVTNVLNSLLLEDFQRE